MANGWNIGSWSIGEWGTGLENVNFIPTGQQLNFSTGSLTAVGEVNEGWGRLTWGENGWNITGDVLLTGIELTTSLGDESIQIDVAPIPTGIELTTTLDSVSEIITIDVFPTGIELTTALGNLDANPDANITGIELTSAVGTALGYNSTGWGRYFWGEEVWGADGIWVTASVTGQELNLTLDNVTIQANANIDINGEQLNVGEGTVDPSPDAIVTGIGMTCDLAVGTVIIGTGNVEVTGEQVTIGLGNAVGDANTIANITGIALTLSLDTVFAGAAVDVEITGNALTITQNSVNVQSWTKINTGTVVTWTEIDTAA